MNTIQSNAIFREEQRFHQPWLWILITISSILLIGIFGYGMYKQLLLGEPWGTNPMSNTLLLILGPIYMLLGAALYILFRTTRLVTEVRSDGLYVRFIPFHFSFKRFRFDEIEEYNVMTYRPIRDFGGWGIRLGRRGWAYNVSGNKGVYFVFRTGKKLMIGSQKPEEFARAVDSMMG
jgi:hypothetical protein